MYHYRNMICQGLGGVISLHTASRPILGLTQPPTQWVKGALSRE